MDEIIIVTFIIIITILSLWLAVLLLLEGVDIFEKIKLLVGLANQGDTMNSNKSHKKLILGFACAVGIAFLFPPYTTKWRGSIVDSGYGFIFELPVKGRAFPTVNVPTLLAEILVILIIGGLVYFALSKK